MRRLPPLNALCAFEAAARLGSIQKASQELCVTHGAVSRHVKLLEEWLGVVLFERSHRSITLTPAGHAYQQTVSAALDLIQKGTIAVQHYKTPNTLGIATTHSIATKWLMERLPTFSKRHPEIEVWLTLEQPLTDFTKTGVDAALRMGEGPWPDLDCIPVLNDRLIPVCSPDLLKGNPLRQPKDLLKHTLLHDQDPSAQWNRWFQMVGQNTISQGPRFTSTDVLLTAAISGQGVALTSEVLAKSDLASGRLVQPLPQAVDLGIYFWLVMPKRNRSVSTVMAFERWLKAIAFEKPPKTSTD